MTMQSASNTVACMEAELISLREKSANDDNMIALLKKQNEMVGMEMTLMAQRHADEMRVLKQRHDLAVRNELEVEGILNTAAKSILEGLRRHKGDALPPVEEPIVETAVEAAERLVPGYVAPMPQVQDRPSERPLLRAFPAAQQKDDDDDRNLRGILNRLPANEFTPQRLRG